MLSTNCVTVPILVAVVTVAPFTTGCVSNRAVQTALTRSATLPAPVAVQRPVNKTLEDFGSMLGPYVTAATGERPIPIEIDFIGNESGIDKELPTDLGQYARAVIERIGGPFETYRTLPAFYAIPRPAGSSLPLVQTDRPKPPEPAYRVVGSLLRASERVVKGRNGRGDALFGGGHTQSDIQLTGDRSRTITSLTLALTLEGPNGVAVRGASAEYRIDVEKTEVNRSISFYVAGSGVGGGSKLTVTQDSGDALYDATAVSILHLLGNALLVPYYRCSSVFAVDETLVKRVQDAFGRLTRSELEQNIKRYLFVDGYDMDVRTPDLTDADRAIVVLEMRRRSFDFSDTLSLVQFAMDLWKHLDYVKAAKKVSDRMTRSAQIQREQLETAAREQAALFVNAAEFGWPTNTRFMIVDLSRVKESVVQDKIIAALGRCVGCDELRAHPTKMLVGVRLSCQPSDIQLAIRAASLRLEYVWLSVPTLRLLLVPLKESTPPPVVAAVAKR